MAEPISSRTKMSKPTKTTSELVRNPIKSVCSSKSVEKAQTLKKVHFVENETEDEEEEEERTETYQSQDLTSPEFCTLLRIVEEMKKIHNTQASRHNIPEGPRYRNLNFQPQEKIFKNLVNLDIPVVSEVKSQTCLKLNSKKDPEPDYGKYLKYSLEPEYTFSFDAVPVVKEPKTVFNRCSDYNRLKLMKEQN